MCKLGAANPHFVVKMCRKGRVHSVHSRGHRNICRGRSHCCWWLSIPFPAFLAETCKMMWGMQKELVGRCQFLKSGLINKVCIELCLLLNMISQVNQYEPKKLFGKNTHFFATVDSFLLFFPPLHFYRCISPFLSTSLPKLRASFALRTLRAYVSLISVDYT